MITRKVKIGIPTGLETRPVAMLVQIASQFSSYIYLENDSKKVNAKSIMGMMTLGLVPGEEVIVTANGSDEDTAIEKIAECLSSN